MSLSSKDVKSPQLEDDAHNYPIPSMDELGHDTSELGEEPFPGGEQEALRRLEENMKKTVILVKFLILPVSLYEKR